MSINIGIVIGCNNPAYEGKAQVRIPALHGLPLAGSIFTNLNNKFSKYIPTSSNALGIYKHSMENYNVNKFGTKGNTKVMNDEDIPWYPIISPYGSNVGPNLYDLVYVLDDSYVVGWTNQSFMPYN